jgi:hypothetical protein
MDAATSKQKANIKGLFIQGGLPGWIFNPSDLWNINKQDADSLIHNLRMMIKYDHEDLKDEIAQSLEGKHIFQTPAKTIDELEEEQATNNLSNEEWIQESQADILREQEVIA